MPPFDSGRLEIRAEPTPLGNEIERATEVMRPGPVAGFAVEVSV